MVKGLYKKGMTLVEVIVVVSLFAIIMLVIISSVMTFYKANSYAIAQAYEIYNARKGVQTLVRDIREMSFADNGTFPLARKEEHMIGFYSDIDRDDSVEYVEYELDDPSTIFVKRIYNATNSIPVYDLTTPDEVITISEYVQNNEYGTSTFYYLDEQGDEIGSGGSVTDVRYIRSQIIVNVDATRNPGQFMLRGSAALRNIINSI